MDRSQKTDWDNSQNESELNSDWKEREKKKKRSAQGKSLNLGKLN